MKILALSNTKLQKSHGGGQVVLAYCEGLRSRGHDIDFFDPGEFTLFPQMTKALSYRTALGMVQKAFSRILKKKYDIVEFYGGQGWLGSALLSCLPTRDFLIIQHSNGIESHRYEIMEKHLGPINLLGEKRKFYQLNPAPMFNLGFRSSDAIVTVSEFDRAYANSFVGEERCISVNNCLSPEFLSLGLPAHKKEQVIYVGNWTRTKGCDLLASDLSSFLGSHPHYHFKIIGVGESFNLDKWFPADLHKQISVIPFVTDKQDLIRHYQECSLAVLPSFYESFGLAAVEAMACGCALVGNPTGYMYELDHLKNVYHLDRPEKGYLHLALATLAGNTSLRQSIAQAGHQKVQDLNWSNSVEKLEKTYQHWLKTLR